MGQTASNLKFIRGLHGIGDGNNTIRYVKRSKFASFTIENDYDCTGDFNGTMVLGLFGKGEDGSFRIGDGGEDGLLLIVYIDKKKIDEEAIKYNNETYKNFWKISQDPHQDATNYLDRLMR